MVNSIIAYGPDLHFVNGEGDTPLLQAIKYGDGGVNAQKIVQLLLDAGAKAGKKDASGLRARRIAKQLGYKEISQIIKAHINP